MEIEQRSRDFGSEHPVKAQNPGNGFLIRVFRTIDSPGGTSHPCSTFLRPSYTAMPRNTLRPRGVSHHRVQPTSLIVVIFLSHDLSR